MAPSSWRTAVATAALSFTVAAWAQAPTATVTVTLDEAIARAVEHNPRLSQALSVVERADASATAARAGWLPTATVNGTLTQLDANRVLGDRVLAPATTLNANLTVKCHCWHSTGGSRRPKPKTP